MLRYTWRADVAILYEALDIYQKLLSNLEIKDNIFEIACQKSIHNLEKVGENEGSAILTIYQKLVSRFPKKYKYKKELGLQYIRKRNNAEAIRIFEEILDQNDTLVKAHLGNQINYYRLWLVKHFILSESRPFMIWMLFFRVKKLLKD